MDNEKSFAIKLADNDKSVRDKSLRNLRNYMRNKAQNSEDPFTRDDLIKLWKGLHYCMWMCDKALIQEKLTENICNLISCFNGNDDQVLLFIQVYYETIIREWLGIDKWRIDKFMMLMRSMLHHSLSYICQKKWNKELIIKFNKMMLENPLNINNDSVPDGVSYHVADIFMEELGKFGEHLKPMRAVLFLQPFIDLVACSKKKPFVVHLQKRLFEQIIECSDVDINEENEQEMKELKAFGLQLYEEEDTSEHVLKFDYKLLAKNLFKAANNASCLERNRKTLYDLYKKFNTLEKGIYPIDDFNLPPLYEDEDIKFEKKLKKSKKAIKSIKRLKNKNSN